MNDPSAWVARLVRELAGDEQTAIPLDPATVGVLLRIAREVAHGSERLNAPLSTYVAGRYVASRVAAGADEAAAIAEVEEAVKRVLAEDSSA
jgi:hypothetical protein